MLEPFAKSHTYWQRAVWGLVVSLVSILGTLLFVVMMNLGIGLIWPSQPGWEPFSGAVTTAVIMMIAGLLVGLIHRYIGAKDENVFAAIVQGRLAPRHLPGSILVALVTLIGGFSLGPEAPTGMLSGGISTWISERRGLSADVKRSNVLSGVMGAYGGLFTSPFAAILIPLELAHRQLPGYYGTLSIAALSAVLGFSVFFALGSDSFASVLRILELPTYTLHIWHMLVAVVLGVLGTVLGLIFGLLLQTFKRLAAPLNNRPVIRSTVGGLMLGLLAIALPLTMFLGTTGLETVTEHGAEMGLILVIVMVFAKMIATTGALSTGFIGGPIFPLFFVGATAGTAVNLIFPEIPLALAVGCLMAAVPGALLPIPLSLGVIVLLITGIAPTEAIPVFISVLVAYFITHGFGLLGRTPEQSTAT